MAKEDDREMKKAKSANRGEILTTLFFGIVIGYLIANPPEDFFTGSLPLIVALIGTPWILHRLAKRFKKNPILEFLTAGGPLTGEPEASIYSYWTMLVSFLIWLPIIYLIKLLGF